MLESIIGQIVIISNDFQCGQLLFMSECLQYISMFITVYYNNQCFYQLTLLMMLTSVMDNAIGDIKITKDLKHKN